MILIFSFIGAVFWFLFVFVLLRVRQNPEAQLRKRLNAMIDQAEDERLKRPIMLKNRTPTSAEGAPQVVQRRETLYARIVQPIINTLEERLQKLAPVAIREQIEEKIFRAGKLGSWSTTSLITCWCLSVGVFTIATLMMIQQHPGINPAQRILFVGLGMFSGAVIPFVILNAKIRKRKKEIRKQLPEFLDILCVSVQAGLSFDGAVAKMIKRMKGPLIDEFKRMQQDVALGVSHQHALSNLANRCDLEEVYLFTTSIIQAEKLGTSMTRTLKVQADNMRDRHRQWIKSEALRAPVKILFPMIIFIFPSMFVVLLFPALFNFMQNINSK